MVMGGDGMRDGPKKRELSQSKRAAQNRAAQVSFPIPETNIAPLAKPPFFSCFILRVILGDEPTLGPEPWSMGVTARPPPTPFYLG